MLHLLFNLLSIATLISAFPIVNDTTPALPAYLFKQRAVSAKFVLTAFTSTSESNLYTYTSDDATNFSLLKGPAYTPPSGLIRDPSVLLHTEFVVNVDALPLATDIKFTAGYTTSPVRSPCMLMWLRTKVLNRHDQLERNEFCYCRRSTSLNSSYPQ